MRWVGRCRREESSFDTARMGDVRLWSTGSAQKGAVAALDELQAIARQANGDFAQCVSGPRGGINFMAGEQSLGDRAILHAGETSVDHPQHLRATRAALLGYAVVGRDGAAADGSQPAADRLGAAGGLSLQ